MSERIDPFLALEPLARALLHRAVGGMDLAAVAAPRNPRLPAALGRLLADGPPAGEPEALSAALLAKAPDLSPHVALLERCAAHLPAVLEGRALATDVLFPGGAMDLVEPVYRGNRWTDHFNGLLARAVARAVAVRRAEDPTATVRILEVGAGTGGTSAAVLRALDPHADGVLYDYTDVSPGFVQHGRRVHGAGRAFLRGRVLDLEADPEAQGFVGMSYDVALGTNVVHATGRIAVSLGHLHRLVRPGGLLLLNEIVRASAFGTMTFGLLDGWWAFRDAERRLADAPLLSPAGWRAALAEAGFGEPAVFGWTDPPEASFQCLFVGARGAAGAAGETTRGKPVAQPPPLEASPAPAPREVAAYLAERLAGLLGLDPEEIAHDRPFAEYGVDSIVAPQFVTLVNRERGTALVPTDVFNHATVAGLARHLAPMLPAAPPPPEAGPAPAAADEPVPPVAAEAAADEGIAVVGLACRFPGAADAEAFWADLVAGRSAVREVPAARWTPARPDRPRFGAFLEDHDRFDPEFFNLSWREAEAMSPQQRLFLEEAWHALENAGYGRRSLAGSRCGVFVGAAPDGYGIDENDAASSLGGSLAILSARISYLLDLKGPSVPVDTACSSSLVAVHLACRSLSAGECDMALAGGVSVLMTDERLHTFLDDAGMLSPTGRCHTFDAAADGFVPGEGVGVVVLKRLADARADGDRIVGVIRGSAVNQDGRTSGITAPSGPSQTALQLDAWERAGIGAGEIGLVEAHGTGTQVGDPIEVNALRDAFRRHTDETGFCAIGSVKTNVGHTLTTAGVAGLVKALLAVRHGTIPPSLGFDAPNPEIDFPSSPFFVPRAALPFTRTPRIAVVSSFGFSGTNAHVVVAEAPAAGPPTRGEAGPALVLLSARTAQALAARRADLLAWLGENDPALADLAFTLAHGRSHFEHRLAIVVDSLEALRAWRGATFEGGPLVLPARGGEDEALADLLAAPEPDLAAIARTYVRGGDGDWSRLWPEGGRRIALPGYPFARLAFPVRTRRAARPAPPPVHPLLGEEAPGGAETAFPVALDPSAPWLAGHRFGGRPVLPAMAFPELAVAAGQRARGAPVASVRDLRLERPLPAGADARIVLDTAGEEATFRVVGADGAVHARGRLAFGAAGQAAAVDLEAVAARLRDAFGHGAIYERFGALGFDYGSAFRVIRTLRAGPGEALAEIAPAVPTDPAIALDPALLDGALQAAVGLMLAEGERLATVVPVAVGAVAIHGRVDGPCRAQVREIARGAGERRLAVDVLDPSGRPLLSLSDVKVRVSGAAGADDAVLAFRPTWEAEAVAPAAPPDALLLFDRDETLWRHLGEAPVLVRPGSAFCRLGPRQFALDPDDGEGWRRLVETLAGEDALPAAAWHLWSLGAGGAAPLRDGLVPVFQLSAALARRTPRAPVTILHAHDGRADGAPHAAAVAGFAAALARENPLLRLVSTGLEATGPADVAAVLAAETAAAAGPAATAWTAAGERTVRRLDETDLPRGDGPPLPEGAVVLLTGGLGGIGRRLAVHLAARAKARLVLVGRSRAGEVAEAVVAEVRAAGGDALYRAADVADEAAVAAVVAEARACFGPLDAVIHAAGVTRDRFLIHKDADDLAAVLAPKVAGTLALHRATADEPLAAFVAFSSLAGSLGNAGQTDYAAANAFLDAFAASRAGPGRSLAIGWPYWEAGGLAVDADERARRAKATGIRSLRTEEGLALFDALLAGGAEGAILLLPGERDAIRRLVAPPAAPREGRAPAAAPPVEAALAYLGERLAEATAMPVERIDPDRPLEQYGMDSLLVTRLNGALERDFPALPKTLFFEHATLRGAAAYLAARHAGAFADAAPSAMPEPAPAPAPARPRETAGGIAIVGIAGRYPGAETLEAFWENLKADRDLVTEIPADRLALYGPAAIHATRAQGAFLRRIDEFDPLFFNIAPAEAARIDPNERLFLEIAWEALENAGHTRASLAGDGERRVGVYAGVMYGEYQLLAAEAHARGSATVGGASPYWSIANRVSYHLDLHGPSLAVDSACSSSLTAIHLACQAIAAGECTAAIAGGVNLSLHPLKHVGLAEGGFAASDGRCHSFAAGGDGYVPGEGVGAVVLKPLEAALADGDYVHAVIRGWAANHGGKTNGYTVPSPAGQGRVIGAALRRAGVAPETISYVEAHGTGTALGDPIEVAGLAAAFGEDAPRQACAIGSVKANVGHLEGAAGIAGLTRVVLQLKHRTLTPTRLHGPLNPAIDFAGSPFHVQDRTAPWAAPGPLRAGVSSFGAGGANAHLVVEEGGTVRAAPGADGPALLVLSARTAGQLAAHAARMAAFLEACPFRLADVARTLQVGREAMTCRLALVAASCAEAAAALAAFAAGEAGPALSGEVEDGAAAPPGPDGGSLEDLARAFVAGAAIDFGALPLPGERVPLPATPLVRRRCWLKMPPAVPATADAALHPFLDRAEPSVDGAVLVKTFRPDEPVIRDHRVEGRLLVPGVVQLEMARAAAERAGFPATGLLDVVWPAPLAVGEHGTEARIALKRAERGLSFEIDAGGETVARGRLDDAAAPTPAPLDVGSLRGRAERRLGREEIYDRLAAMGLSYGPSLAVLEDVRVHGGTVVAALAPAPREARVRLPPAALDGALQALLGFAAAAAGPLFVPFALAEARLLADLADARFVVATRGASPDGLALFDLEVTDGDGRPLLLMRGLAARPKGARPAAPAAQFPLAVRLPTWRARALPPAQPPARKIVIAHRGDDLGLADRLGGAVHAVGQGEGDGLVRAAEGADEIVWIAAPAAPAAVGEDAEAMALDLLAAVKALDAAGRLGRELTLRVLTRRFQSVSPKERPDPRAGAVLGLAKCLPQEIPRLSVVLVDVDDPALADPSFAGRLLAEPPAVPVREVAWRGGVRHVLVPAPADLPAPAPALLPGTTVMIVGGAGGIGLEIAGWLARTVSARVALVGRRAEAAVAERIAATDAGRGEIRYLPADVTDREAMAGVVARLRAAWGAIDGAIHAALVLSDRTLARMDGATFRAALAPKLAGSVAMAEALAGEPLSFFAFLSSVNVLSGSRGQANYVAASSFVDGYARALAAAHPWRVLTVDWGFWGGVGVVSDETYRVRLARQGVHPIEPAEGVAAFASALASGWERVAIARAEPEARLALGLDEAAPDAGDGPDAADGTDAADATDEAFAVLERFGRVRLQGVLLDLAEGAAAGKAWTTEGLRRGLGVADRHGALFPALLDALARDGLVEERDGLWRLPPDRASLAAARTALDAAEAAAPWLAGPRRLLEACLDAYPALLTGAADPLAVLFPGASMELVEAAYAGNPVADRFNRALAEAARAAAASGPADAPFRVVEIGAGTGSTTAVAMEALAGLGRPVAYLATDVSHRFLAHGEARFAGREGLSFALLDVERTPEENGLEAGAFDLAIAANVLHATADLSATLENVRRLLRPGGRLLLSEATRRQDFGTLVFGLTPGWWRARDRERRIPFSPLVRPEEWLRLLGEAGFSGASVAAGGAAAPHSLLMAENGAASAVVAAEAPVRAAAPVPAAGEPAEKLEEHLRGLLAEVLKLEPGEVRRNEGFDRYGLESLTALEIRNRLDRDIPGLPATLLFEHDTIARLAAWLADTHPEPVARLLAGSPSADASSPADVTAAQAVPPAEAVPSATAAGAAPSGPDPAPAPTGPQVPRAPATAPMPPGTAATGAAAASPSSARASASPERSAPAARSAPPATGAAMVAPPPPPPAPAVPPAPAAAAGEAAPASGAPPRADPSDVTVPSPAPEEGATAAAGEAAPASGAPPRADPSDATAPLPAPEEGATAAAGEAAPASGAPPRADPSDATAPLPAPEEGATASPAGGGSRLVAAASAAGGDEPVAIVGFAGRFPGGPDPEAFWRLLAGGDSAIGEVPAERWDAAATFDPSGAEGRSYTRWAGFIADVDRFDPLFFNISPLEAEVMDPQERLFLETAWATLEAAGYAPALLKARAAAAAPDGGDVGVFVGVMNAPYQWVAAEAWTAGHADAAATSPWGIANRVSFQLDFTGPSLAVDTACSASLTAIHLACESLRRGECGAAIAGGVNLLLHPRQLVNLSQARMVSRGAECRAFGEGADGFVDGEGVGAVLLKPLSAAERDGDRIEGVILGTAANAGGRTSGFTVPSPAAQARVIRRALARSGIAPQAVTFVETHGTGTALGDPIEIAGLTEALGGAGRTRPCALGAVKANVGHLESAAGVAGLVKILLQFRHRTIAPSRHAATPNPLIDFSATPFALPSAAIPWEPAEADGRLLAGLSSFGAGGANAHVVLASPPAPAPAPATGPLPDLVVLSAADGERLRTVAANLLPAIRSGDLALADVAHTLRVGREALPARLAVLADDLADLVEKLEGWLAGSAGPGVLTGGGRAARGLSETAEGRRELDDHLARADLPRLGALWVEGADIDWSALALPGRPRRVALPTYPFRRERYWLPVPDAGGRAPATASEEQREHPRAGKGEEGAAAAPPRAPEARPTAAGGPGEGQSSAGAAGASEPPPAEHGVAIRLFVRDWRPEPAVRAARPAATVVLSADAALAARLSALSPGPVEAVALGGAEGLDPRSEADLAALAQRLVSARPEGFALVVAPDRAEGPDGVPPGLLLAKALVRTASAPVRLLHLHDRAGERPLDGAFGALARSVGHESDTVSMRAVGIEGPADAVRAARIVRDELAAADGAPEVLYRGGARLVPAIRPVAPSGDAGTIAFRIGGAYLLVGGLGEVGCALAERLHRDYRARIAVIGRSDPDGAARERLERLREAGVQLLYRAADLCDPPALAAAVADVRAAFGRLHGVVHLARTVEDGLLAGKSTGSLARVMAAKVAGTRALDAALAEEELDWFVLCSSLASWLGLAGGADYAFACAFQGAFARTRERMVARGERAGRTVAVAWPQWRHDAFLTEGKLRHLAAEGLATIDARDGLRILADALGSGEAEVAALKGTEEALARLPLAYGPPADAPRDGPETDAAAREAADDLADELARLTDEELAAYLDLLEAGAPPAPAAAAEPQPSAEAVVIETICEYLKLPPERFGEGAAFAEFGLDSIKALNVAERLGKRLGVEVDPAMFYEFPTVDRFARAVAGRSAAQPVAGE